MFFLTGGYFFMELISGIVAQSLALQADAMHMLSDFLGLAIGFSASLLSGKKSTSKRTYGYIRMEVIGALINSTYLLATCISILFEAIERLRHLDDVCERLSDKVNLVMIVGIVGLVVNLLGLLIFCGAATHGHSHALDECDHCDDHHGHAHGEHGCDHHDSHGGGEDPTKPTATCCDCFNKGVNLNIMGVFLHLAGDALGSVVVIIATIIIRFGTQEKTIRCASDPIGSLIIVAIILCSAIPLFLKCISILLHTTPKHIDLDAMSAYIKDIPDVIDVQEFHCWQLNGKLTVVTMHVTVYDDCNWPVIYSDIKSMLDKRRIQSSSIQPDFLSRDLMC